MVEMVVWILMMLKKMVGCRHDEDACLFFAGGADMVEMVVWILMLLKKLAGGSDIVKMRWKKLAGGVDM